MPSIPPAIHAAARGFADPVGLHKASALTQVAAAATTGIADSLGTAWTQLRGSQSDRPAEDHTATPPAPARSSAPSTSTSSTQVVDALQTMLAAPVKDAHAPSGTGQWGSAPSTDARLGEALQALGATGPSTAPA